MKFQNRAQRLANTDVRVVSQLSEASERSLFEALSFFADKSDGSAELMRRLGPVVDTFPLVLYHLEYIVKHLATGLRDAPKVALKIAACLAKDVKQELGPYFESHLLPELIKLIDNTELYDELFNSLPLILKHIINGINPLSVIKASMPLILHKDPIVRHMAAQCYAFLLRKAGKGAVAELLKAKEFEVWNLVKQTVTRLHCLDVLEETWEYPEVARVVHLAIAQDEEAPEQLWASIRQRGDLELLKNWLVMSKGRKVPEGLNEEIAEFILQSLPDSSVASAYYSKSRGLSLVESTLEKLSLDQQIEFWGILTGYNDPHPEEEFNQTVIDKAIKNYWPHINLTPSSHALYKTVSLALTSQHRIQDAITLLLWTLQNCTLSRLALPELEQMVHQIDSDELLWLVLNLCNALSMKVEVPERDYCDEVKRELYLMKGQVPQDDLKGEVLWTAAELQIPVQDASVLEEYLTHPTLRVPAIYLISLTSPLTSIKLMNEISSEKASLETEKFKIAHLKRLQLHLEECPETITKFLLGMYWERLSSLWPHVTEILGMLANVQPETVWKELVKLINNPPVPSKSFPSYELFSTAYEFTPERLYYRSILSTFASVPNLSLEFASDFFGMFWEFVKGKYLLLSHVSGLSDPSSGTDRQPELHFKLSQFLTVLKNFKDLRRAPDFEFLKDFLLRVCLKKAEDLRILAVDCLIRCKGDESENADILKGLAKDSDFRAAALKAVGSNSKAVTALAASRAFNKSKLTAAAIELLNSLEPSDDLLSFAIPYRADVFAKVPIRRQLSQMTAMRTIAKRMPMYCFAHREVIAFYLLEVIKHADQNDLRDLRNKAFAGLNFMLNAKTISDEGVDRLVALAEPHLTFFAVTVKPKLIDLLNILSKEHLRVFNGVLVQAAFDLLRNEKLSQVQATSAVRTVCSFLESLTEGREAFVGQLQEGILVRMKSGVSEDLQKLISLVPIVPSLSVLAKALLPFSFKVPSIFEILRHWLVVVDQPPLHELFKLLMKHKKATELVGSVLAEPYRTLLYDLSATKRVGLNIEVDYGRVIAALYRVSEEVQSYPEDVLEPLTYAVSHLIIKTDLGMRTSTTQALKAFPYTNYLEQSLSLALKRCTEDEEARAILTVFCHHKPIELEGDLPVLVHLQTPTRVKAMQKLKELQLTKEELQYIFLPLLNYLLLNSSERANYKSQYIVEVTSTLASLASRLSWTQYYALLKIYMKKSEGKTELKGLCALLASPPGHLSDSATNALRVKVLPKLKLMMVDKEETWKVKVRKSVVVATYYVIKTLPDSNAELHRLVGLLAYYFTKNNSTTRDTVLKSVKELLKHDASLSEITHEFSRGLDNELLANFFESITATYQKPLPSFIVERAAGLFADFELYKSFYDLAKLASPQDLKFLLGCPRALEHVARGINENTNFTPIDRISMGLSLLNKPAKAIVVVDKELSRKLATYTVQTGAASGTRPSKTATKKENDPEKVLGIRLVKTGLKQSKEGINHSVAASVLEAARSLISHSRDEVVSGCLEIIKQLGDESDLPRILKLAEVSGEEMSNQVLRTVAEVVRSPQSLESHCEVLLPLISLAVQTHTSASAALKLLRQILSVRIMHPTVYDVMESVPNLLLTAPVSRATVTSIYLEFLLHYPLSEKRLNVHMDFLFKNLTYPDIDAKKALVEAAKHLIDRIPAAFNYDFYILVLVCALANEDLEVVQESLVSLLKVLMEKCPANTVRNEVGKWLEADQPGLQRAAYKVLAVMLELGQLSQEMMIECLKKHIKVTEDAESSPLRVELLVKGLAILPPKLHKRAKRLVKKFIQQAIQHKVKLSSAAYDLVDKVKERFLETILKGIEAGQFEPEWPALLRKANLELCVKKTAGLCRKLIGRGQADHRVEGLLKFLAQSVQDAPLKPLFKTVIIAGELPSSSSVKQAAHYLFEQLHSRLDQTEFVELYNKTRKLIENIRSTRRNRMKELAVIDPERAVAIKLARRKRKRSLGKKWLKDNPHKRVKRESLRVVDKH
mmetsp:Transcript_19716/g.36314  ORF Transcript_19716/g.36314 Transcript_19716/m.36314 type:complete len:2012 (+) Transcript_19716:43-6078(+)